MTIIPNFFGLLIGANYQTNPYFTTLPPTINDVDCIYKVLTDPQRGAYPANHTQRLIGENASASSLRLALHNLINIPSSATVFIYFSGHGLRIKTNEQWQAYICPNDANPYDIVGTLITADEFSLALAAIPAQRLAVIIDACHAGGLVALKDNTLPHWQPQLTEDIYAKLSQGSGHIVIASSRAEEYSYIHTHEPRSLFTHYLCEALNGAAAIRGDGFIYILDVFHHVSINVQEQESSQQPILKANDLTSFPIAMDHGGLGAMSMSSSQSSPRIAKIREQIINNPLQGAGALSELVITLPNGEQWRLRIELRRTKLQQIQNEEDLYLHLDNNRVVEREQVIYDLFRICTEIEQSGID